jgi:serine/threonine protein kinase
MTSPVQPTLANRFTLQAIAGRGGMGVVHRALDLHTGQPVAVKVLREGDVDTGNRFLREAEVLARMTHSGIVRHVAHGATAEGHPYLVMEWLEGEDLADRLHRGPLTALDAAHLGADIAEALAFAHEHGVVHRDLKPANVYLVGCALDGVRLLDFGIARLRETPSSATRTGTVMGTPAYMAPEQARGDRALDGRADLFSLGCVLYECLAGRPPFVADSAMAVLIKVLLEEPPSLHVLRPDVPPGLSALVARLLAKDPGERPESAQDVAHLLRAVDPHALTTQTLPSAGLTRHERRIVTLLVAEDPWPGQAPPAWTSQGPSPLRDDEDAPTLQIEADDVQPTLVSFAGGALTDLQRRLATLGTRLHRLLDGTLVATLDPQARTQPGEVASRVARCALLLRAALPDVAMVVATGYGLSTGEAGGDVAVGEAIEAAARALRLLKGQDRHCIAVDDATVGLLGGRFQVVRTQTAGPGFAWTLQGDRAAETLRPSLLGLQTPCVGRGRELGILRSVVETCDEAGGAKLLVTARSGLGKSRLLEEFLSWLRKTGRPAQVWTMRAEAIGQDSPYGVLAELMARAADLQAGMDDAERALRLKARLDRAVPQESRGAVVDLARVVLGMQDGHASERLRAAREDPALMADLVRDGLAAWLHAEARQGLLVLVIDDLQWSDGPTLRAIGAVHELLMDEPILFLGLARPEVHERFPTMRQDPRVLELQLAPLSRRASEQLVRAVLGPDVPPDHVDRLVALAAGEAFYLEELIRTTAAGESTLPTTVLAMAQARLDALDGEARRVLRAASVFGMQGWNEGIAHLAGGQVDVDIERLVQAELLVRTPRSRLRGQVELSFRHAFLREAAYAMLTEADRALGHRLAAAWLAQAGETDPSVLGAHLEAGGDLAGALEQMARAAEQGMAAGDFEGARRQVERGQGLAPPPLPGEEPVMTEGLREALARLQLVRAELEMVSGRSSEALVFAEAATDGLRPGSRLWYRAVAEKGRALIRSPRFTEAPAAATLFLSAVPDADAAEVSVFSAARLAVNLMFADMVQDADRLIDFAEAQLAQAGADAGVAAAARLAGARSSRKALAGDLAGALLETQAAATGFQALGDARNACAQQLDFAVLRFRMGQFALAELGLVDALALTEQLELQAAATVARIWLGATLHERGRRAEGMHLLLRAEEELRTQSISLPHCWCLYQLGRAALVERDLPNAERHTERLVQLARPLGNAAWPQAAALQARVWTAQGRVTEALTLATAACTAWHKGTRVAERGILPWLALAEAQFALGDRVAARASTQGAWTLVQQMAGQWPDPEMRQAFLTAVPEHRTLLTWLAPSS